MNKTFAVIRREYVERVRSKAFLISTILVPVFMVLVMLLPMLLLAGGDRTSRIAVVDASGVALGTPLATTLKAARFGSKPEATPRYAVSVFPATAATMVAERDRLIAQTGLSGEQHRDGYDGVLVLAPDTLASGKLAYYGTNVGSPDAMARLQRDVSDAISGVRLATAGVDEGVVKRAMARADVSTTKVEGGRVTGQSGMATFGIAYAMGFILYLAIVIYGQQMTTSVIEEKTSRIMEVLTSSLTPFQMLMGKVFGVGLAGLTQMAIWGGSAFALGSQGGNIAGAFGASAEAAKDFALPGMPVSLLVVFLLYFALGFLLFGALFAAVGAMCNSIQETQQYILPVTMLTMIGFFAVFALIKDPNGGIGATLSLIPFFSPFTMPVRWSMTSVPLVQLGISLALMVLGLLACVWLAGRIYRTGILMYGKKPSWRELWRWIRVG
jgi:ABC-2 type transport system permease protein